MKAFDLLPPERVQYWPKSAHGDECLCCYCEDDTEPGTGSRKPIVVSHHRTDGRALIDGPHFIAVCIASAVSDASIKVIRFGLADIRESEAVALAAVLRRSVADCRSFLSNRDLDANHWFSVHESAPFRKGAITLSVNSSHSGQLSCYLYGGPLQLSLGNLSTNELLRVAAALCRGWSPPVASLSQESALGASATEAISGSAPVPGPRP